MYSITIGGIALTALALLPARLPAQQSPKPYTLREIEYLLGTGVTPDAMLERAAKRCINFVVDDSAAARLRAVKRLTSPEALIDGLRQTCVGGPGAPVPPPLPPPIDTGMTVRIAAGIQMPGQVTTDRLALLNIEVTGEGLADTVRLRTNLDGIAVQTFVPGSYQLSARKAVANANDTTYYSWSLPFTVPGTAEIVISNENAEVDSVRKVVRIAPERALAELMRPAVFTAWGTNGKATAFLADSAGLVLTSARPWTGNGQPSNEAYVQIDSATKVRALVVALDTAAGRDVAVLAINMRRCAKCRALRLADTTRSPIVSVQDKVLMGAPASPDTPLGYTAALVSRVDRSGITTTETSLTCTLGGPLVAEDSAVVGISTCRRGSGGGAAFATAAPITGALAALRSAREAVLRGTVQVSDALIWAYPSDPFPADAYGVYANGAKFDRDAYAFDAGPWRVFVMTPPVVAWRQRQAELRSSGAVDPIQGWEGWAELREARRAAVVINVVPKEFRFPYYETRDTKDAKSAFGDLRLLRQDTATVPIERAHVPAVLNGDEYERRGKRVPTQGIYVFRDREFALTSTNQLPSLRIEIRDAQGRATTVGIPPKLVKRVQDDFAVYRTGGADGGTP